LTEDRIVDYPVLLKIGWTVWTAASYAIVMLVIGLPLWWQTTTVQRVLLPYDDMLNLHSSFQKEFPITTHFKLQGFTSHNLKGLHDGIFNAAKLYPGKRIDEAGC